MLHATTVLTISNLILGFMEGLVGLRVILKLLGARTAAPFVRWVYETSQPLLAPFEGMFPSPEFTGGFVIEMSALFAILVYAFLGYLLTGLLNHVEDTATRPKK